MNARGMIGQKVMALFVSDTPCFSDPDAATVRATVDATLERLGPDECYARAAEVFGDRPDVSLERLEEVFHLD